MKKSTRQVGDIRNDIRIKSFKWEVNMKYINSNKEHATWIIFAINSTLFLHNFEQEIFNTQWQTNWIIFKLKKDRK